MKKLRVGINGFGRIGRIASRIILQRPKIEIAAINSRASVVSHAYLLKYDSTYRTLSNVISYSENFLNVDRQKIVVFNADRPSDIHWNKTKVDIVIDATGKFRTEGDLKGHLKCGAKYVVISAPAKDAIKTFVMGVNHNSFNAKTDKIVSNSSCTTNCLSTSLKVLHKNFIVKQGFMTTMHAVTDSQNLLDNSHKKEVRLRRSAFTSMIPASTGSARDIGKLFPDLSGKIICQAIRIPTPTVSMINLTVEVGKKTSKDEVNNAYIQASRNELKGILAVAGDELVSCDYIGNPNSCVIDPYLTQVIENRMINVFAWYDNEWGYTNRLIDLVEFIGKKSGIIS